MSDAAMKPNSRGLNDGGFTDNLGKVKDDIAGLGRDVAAAAKSGLSAAKDGIASTYDSAKDKGGEYLESLSKSVKNRPMTSAAIALGVGFLVGMYIFRPRA